MSPTVIDAKRVTVREVMDIQHQRCPTSASDYALPPCTSCQIRLRFALLPSPRRFSLGYRRMASMGLSLRLGFEEDNDQLPSSAKYRHRS